MFPISFLCMPSVLALSTVPGTEQVLKESLKLGKEISIKYLLCVRLFPG